MSDVTVYLVGAGPGDAGLITVRGADVLRAADVVLYDYLASDELLSLAPSGARILDVGKRGFTKHLAQGELNALLVREARDLAARGGGTLVRLKGGDPFLFGRGGEEALALREAGIAFEVVPGVTSGIAAPAYAGIPVTHRGLSSSVTFVTGHEDPQKNETAIDWDVLARLAAKGGTLCFYMGMRNLELIVERLVANGLNPQVPAAIIQQGTSNAQRAVVAPLGDIVARAREEGLGAPAIILAGPVALLHDELSWFEARPLFGRRIVVTRSRAQASALSARLGALGAQVMELPTIAFAEPDDFAPLDAAIARLAEFDWVVFTSVNGVDAFFGRLQGAAAAGRVPFADARALGGVRVAAIGPATAKRLAARGIVADAVPGEYRGEAVFAALADVSAACGIALDGARVLLPRAQEARESLPHLLREAGAQVEVLAAYKTVVPAAADAATLADALRAGEVDAITFTSSSTVRNLLALLGPQAELLRGVKLASIGPITSRTLADAGFDVAVEAAEYTIPGLVDALVAGLKEV